MPRAEVTTQDLASRFEQLSESIMMAEKRLAELDDFENLPARVQELRSEVVSLEDKRVRLFEDLSNDINEKVRRYEEGLMENIKALQGQQESLRAEIRGYNSDIESLKNKYKDDEDSLSEDLRSNIKHSESILKTLKDKVSAAQAELNSIKIDHEMLEVKFKARADNLESNERVLQQRTDTFNRGVLEVTNNLEAKTTELEKWAQTIESRSQQLDESFEVRTKELNRKADILRSESQRLEGAAADIEVREKNVVNIEARLNDMEAQLHKDQEDLKINWKAFEEARKKAVWMNGSSEG